MKKNFIIVILFALAMVFTGCHKNGTEYQIDNSSARFQITYSQNVNLGVISIIYDKETGNKYLFYKNGYNAGGLTKLEE